MQKIQITGRGIKTTEAIQDYITKKMDKVSKVFNRYITIDFEIQKIKQRIGVTKEFEIEVTVHLPKAYIRVERKGENVYQLIDEVEPVVRRLVTKYKDRMSKKYKKSRLAEELLLNYQ